MAIYSSDKKTIINMHDVLSVIGGIEKMLEKQLEFAKDIIEEENHHKSQWDVL